MQAQFRQKPIFVPIINHLWTPNNNSILIVKKWFEQLYGLCEVRPLDTWMMTKENFKAVIRKLIGNATSICFYICLQGKQYINEKTHQPEEFLMINERERIQDVELSNFINSLKWRNLCMFLEVCHGGGLINTIKLDDTIRDMANANIVIFNVCSKEKKCYVVKKDGQSIGEAAQTIYSHQINPFSNPSKALEILKRIYPHLHTKVTIIKNLS